MKRFNAETQKRIVEEYAQWGGQLTFDQLAKQFGTDSDTIAKIVRSQKNRKYHAFV